MKSSVSQFIWPTYLYEFENPYLFAVHLISHKSPLELENINSFHGTQGLFSCELLECLLYNIRLSHILINEFLKNSTAICICQVYVFIKWQSHVIRDVGRSEILEGEGSIISGGQNLESHAPLASPLQTSRVVTVLFQQQMSTKFFKIQIGKANSNSSGILQKLF